MIKSKAEQRRQLEARRGIVRPPFRLRPMRHSSRHPRSIVQLKEEIRKQNTSDADAIVPHKETDYSYLFSDEVESKEKGVGKTAHNKETNNTGKAEQSLPSIERQSSFMLEGLGYFKHLAAPLMPSTIDEEIETMSNEFNDFTDTEVTQAFNPVLVTEKVPRKLEQLEPVPGRALNFVCHQLSGKLHNAYNKEKINPIIIEINQEADLIEDKLKEFLGITSQNSFAIQKMKRLNKTKHLATKPGGRCVVDRNPCKAMRGNFQVANHQHVTHFMLDE